MGDAYEVKNALLAISTLAGMTYNQTPMHHKIVFSYKDKIAK
jgi:hypothetical protein